jgi:hypothetical protein
MKIRKKRVELEVGQEEGRGKGSKGTTMRDLDEVGLCSECCCEREKVRVAKPGRWGSEVEGSEKSGTSGRGRVKGSRTAHGEELHTTIAPRVRRDRRGKQLGTAGTAERDRAALARDRPFVADSAAEDPGDGTGTETKRILHCTGTAREGVTVLQRASLSIQEAVDRGCNAAVVVAVAKSAKVLLGRKNDVAA